MASTKKAHNHATDDDFDNQILYNEAEEPSALSKNKCGVCERYGFPLFLVRESIITENYRNIKWNKGMDYLGDYVPEPMSRHENAYRTLRTGYLYILAQETTGRYRYLAYEITPSGVFRHKSIENVVEHNIHEIPKKCTAKNDHIPGVFINIDRSRYSGIAYLGYSRRAWSKPALDHYREAANKGHISLLERFSKINLGKLGTSSPTTEELNSGTREEWCFPLSDFRSTSPIGQAIESMGGTSSSIRKLMEIELGPNEVLYSDPDTTVAEQFATKKLNSDCFITAHKFNSFKISETQNNSSILPNTSSFVDKLFSHADTLAKKNNTPVSVVVIQDYFGVAEELCLQRQLYVDPILMLIEKSENKFSENIAKVFKDRLDGQNDLDKFDVLFKEAIDNYKENYPDEAKKIYKDDTKNSSPTNNHVSPKIAKLTLFEDLYHQTSSLYLQPYVADQEYFSEKSLHLRKLIDMIDNYNIHLKDYFNNSEEFKYHTVFETKSHVDTNVSTTNNALYFTLHPELYEEIIISEKEKARLIAKQNAMLEDSRSGLECASVRIFKSKKSEISSTGRKEYATEKNKLEKHIKSTDIETFTKKNNKYLDNIFKSLEDYSADYFTYLEWLFNSDERDDYPYQNKNHFWLIECDQNCSNNHLGYLQDFIKMTDFNMVNGSPMLGQFKVWDSILSHKKSIYYRLFNSESENGFWNLILNERITQKLNSKMKESDKTLKNTIAAVKKKHHKALDPSFCENKGQKIIDLYQVIIQSATVGASQYNTLRFFEAFINYKPKMDRDLFKNHLCQAMMVFNKTHASLIKVTVPIDKVDNFFQYWSSNNGVFIERNDKETLALLNQVNPYQTPGDGAYAADTKSTKQWTFDVLDLENSIYSELTAKRNFSSNIGVTKLKVEYEKIWKDAGKLNLKITTVSELGRSAFLNALSLYMTYEGLSNNLAELSMTQYGQAGQLYIDRLKSDIVKGKITFAAQMIVAIDSALKFVLGEGKQIAFFIYGKSSVKIANAIIKGTTGGPVFLLNSLASGVLAISAIFEGALALQSAGKLVANGEIVKGTITFFCAALQFTVAILSLLKLFHLISFTGPWAGLLFAISSLAMLLVYIFRDESQDWVPIEIWANRTLFGRHDYPKKWPTYPPTLLGTGIATNDYLAAIQGLNGNIEFGQKNESTYYNRLPLVIEQNSKLNEEYQKYSAEMANAQNDETKASLSSKWVNFASKTCGLTNQQVSAAQTATREVHRINKGKGMADELSTIKNVNKYNASNSMQGLYIQMTLPKYDRIISKLEAYLHISSGDKTMILSINNGLNFPKITNISADILPTVALRTDNKEPIRDVKHDNTEGVTKNEYYDKIKRPKTQIETGLPILVYNEETKKEEPIWEETDSFKITYKVAEIYGDHTIYLKVNYWQEGKSKVIKMADDTEQTISLAPLVQVYNYQQ